MENQGIIEYIDPEDDFLPYRDPERYANQPNYYRYFQLINAYKGFEVGEDPNRDVDEFDHLFGIIRRARVITPDTVEEAKFAIQEFNKLKGTNLELERIVKVNYSLPVVYMTLECKDGRFYEAKVESPFEEEESILEIFRPAKHYPLPNDSSSPGGTSSSSDGSEGSN